MKSHFYAFVLVNHFWIFFQFYFYWDWGDAAELNAVSRVETEHGFIEIADYISFNREEIEMHILCNFSFYHVYWLFIVSKCFKLLENKMKIFVPCLFVHLLVVLSFTLSGGNTLLVWSACPAAFFQDLSFLLLLSCAVLWQLNPCQDKPPK